jgi:adenylosuccinate synthase
MQTAEVLRIYKDLERNQDPHLLSAPLGKYISSPSGSKRPYSASVEDAFFGDSGKGSVVAKLNERLAKNGKVFSLRPNGGANAGHEADINGKKIVTHQMPMAVVKEGATAFFSRGEVLHPEDGLIEIDHINDTLGTSELPGNLIIDHNALLALDTHRAYEAALNEATTEGRGSTGRGIAPSYMDFYGRIAKRVKDLTREDWEEGIRGHYRLYQKMVRGFGMEIEDIEVYTMASEKKRRVGSEEEFIDRLREARTGIKKYVASNVYDLLTDAWINNSDIPFTIEHAQGAGIDVFHGVYPDVTAGRTMSRNINDATYNIILPEQIGLRAAVMKATYMSSVGIRKLPKKDSEEYREYQHRIQEEFDEKGRSTGRLRDIYPVSVPIAQYLRRAAGYEYLVATHLDASKEGEEFEVVIGYQDKVTGKERPYSPYQEDLDTLEPVTVRFKGWDGEAVKQIRSPKDLPYETRLYLAFLSKTIAPVAFGTTGPQLSRYISWFNFAPSH